MCGQGAYKGKLGDGAGRGLKFWRLAHRRRIMFELTFFLLQNFVIFE